jgi:hypothetical protein
VKHLQVALFGVVEAGVIERPAGSLAVVAEGNGDETADARRYNPPGLTVGS